MQTAEIYAKNT